MCSGRKLASGSVIVPAYLSRTDQISLLDTTLQTLLDESFHVIAVLQGEAELRTHAASRFGGNGVKVRELPSAVGKWPAVTEGLRSRQESDQWIAVVDADGAYRGSEIRELVEMVADNRADHVIGQRDSVQLNAVDDVTGNSRLHVEAFFDTLAQLLVTNPGQALQPGLDIQCGVHAFSNAQLDTWWPHMPYYGGELLLYLKTVATGRRLGVAPVTHADAPSSYSVREIVDNILSIEQIASAPPRLFDRALHLAPSLYRDWINNPRLFAGEIRGLVADRWPR
jgi:glycosyltransferase involved in cell wall biosynthesis